MDVYVLRHGKAELRSPSIKSDYKRALTVIGKKDLQHISKAIKNMNIKFDYIISSPLLRARQTAEIVLSFVKTKRSIVFWNELKPESSVEEISKKLYTLKPDSSVLLVGHEPILSELVGSLISDGTTSIILKKGGFAHVQCVIQNSIITGTLRSLLTPKQLRLYK